MKNISPEVWATQTEVVRRGISVSLANDTEETRRIRLKSFEIWERWKDSAPWLK